MSTRTEDPAAPPSRAGKSWFVTVALMALLIGGALWWQRKQQAAALLPRTRQLVVQKVGSLEAYNQPMSEGDLLESYSQDLRGRTVHRTAFFELGDQITGRLVLSLWRLAQQRSSDSPLVTHRAMADVIHEKFPQQLLPNGDVVLFPDDVDLRIVVAEPLQDFFRDTAWHWRWIGAALDRASLADLQQLRELDIYAAEELSEFLSVLGVAVIHWADRFSEQPRQPLFSADIEAAFATVAQWSATDSVERPQPVLFSPLTKRQVAEALPRPMFLEVTKAMSLDFVHQPNPQLRRQREALEVSVGFAGGGVSAGDFNADGYVDLYFAGDGGGKLYRNAKGKRFEDVSDAAGLLREGETRAGYFVDYDNDGDLDLFLTFVGKANKLYRNMGSRADGAEWFEDVSEASGIGGRQDTVSHEAVWFDFDNDGLLDVYVANFGTWHKGDTPTIGRHNDNAPPNELLHHRVHDGKHVFEDVTEKMKVGDRGWTHCVGAWDFDHDGYLDLMSLNDFGASLVYRNLGGQGFEEGSRLLHMDIIYNAMNFELLDLDHSGHLAVYVSQIHKLTHRERYSKPTEQTPVRFDHVENLRALVDNMLLQHRADGVFANVHDVRIEPADMGWAWDASTFDYENDGDLELLVLNGTEAMSKIPVVPGEQRDKHLASRVYMSRFDQQRNVCFVSQDGYFYDMSENCELCYSGNSRGAAYLDWDNDGDLDVAINDYDDPARLFENVQKAGHHWIRLQLQGAASNRNGVGARVEIRFGGRRRFAQVVSGKGFLSQNPLPLHFGLGAIDQLDEVIVTWPSGRVQKLDKLEVDQMHVIRENDGTGQG